METLPAWNIQTEYPSLASPEFDQDLQQAKTWISEIEHAMKEIAPLLASPVTPEEATVRLVPALQQISRLEKNATVIMWNLRSYVGCEQSVDAKNAPAQKLQSQLQKVSTEFSTVMKPFDLFLTACDPAIFAEYLNSEETRPETFYWTQKRKQRDLMLSPAEETTITQFNQFALHGWGELYNRISGSLKVHLPSKGEIGAAEASGYLRAADEKLRQEAWTGLQNAWKVYEEPCAAILNNMAGARHEEYKKRSHTRKIDFLEFPLRDSKIERATLEAMMSAVQSRIEVPRRALKAMAKGMGKTRIDPWDILAPSPRAGKSSTIPFAQATEMIHGAFAGVHPSMGEFIQTMVKNQWIESRVMPNKRPGAFCTGFVKSRTPRVYQTYMGSYNDVSTLSHELGHAYHSWVMRDMPLIETYYPMTLAETASIFAETALAEDLMMKGDADTKFAIAWDDASSAASFLVNIPARFDFEKSLYEARLNGALSPAELSDMTDNAWRKWYGEEISETERQYWMTKLHFSISGVSFYNFPYTFGYLFSLGIYAKRAEMGADFFKAYTEILRDTGRMTAEDLIQKHLGQDIRKPEFWLGSIGIVEKKVTEFEKMLSTH